MSKQNLLLLVLIVSVSVNLLVAGVVIGRAGVKRPPEPPPAAWAAEQLDPATRQLVRRRMGEQMQTVRPLREEMRAATRDIRRAVSAEPYDPVAMADALARLRDVKGRYEALIHDSFAELSADLPKRQRVALLRAALERRMQGQPGAQTKRPLSPGG